MKSFYMLLAALTATVISLPFQGSTGESTSEACVVLAGSLNPYQEAKSFKGSITARDDEWAWANKSGVVPETMIFYNYEKGK